MATHSFVTALSLHLAAFPVRAHALPALFEWAWQDPLVDSPTAAEARPYPLHRFCDMMTPQLLTHIAAMCRATPLLQLARLRHPVPARTADVADAATTTRVCCAIGTLHCTAKAGMAALPAWARNPDIHQSSSQPQTQTHTHTHTRAETTTLLLLCHRAEEYSAHSKQHNTHHPHLRTAGHISPPCTWLPA